MFRKAASKSFLQLALVLSHFSSLSAQVSSQTECASAFKMAFQTRNTHIKVLSVEQDEVAGARVRRSIGRPELRNFDPFLMLDEFSGSGTGFGFPDHPHRGFETVTYMLGGKFKHEDFLGHAGTIGPGDLQWMTAGRGIVHAEMPDLQPGERAHGLQLWVNLAAKNKMVAPRYQELPKEKVPRTTVDGVTAIVIAGEALGISSPVQTLTPTHYLHFIMEPNKTLEQKIPSNMNAFIYILSGTAEVGEKNTHCEAHHTITLTPGGDGVIVKTTDVPCSFVLLAGEPLNEPVVQHGPFVMNTPQEIRQAIMDYSSGSNGFEAARKWRSKIGEPLM